MSSRVPPRRARRSRRSTANSCVKPDHKPFSIAARFSLPALIEAVKVSRIFLKNFSDCRGCDSLIVAQQMNGVELGRRIMVAVVGADHQTILARMAQNIRQII